MTDDEFGEDLTDTELAKHAANVGVGCLASVAYSVMTGVQIVLLVVVVVLVLVGVAFVVPASDRPRRDRRSATCCPCPMRRVDRQLAQAHCARARAIRRAAALGWAYET